MSQRPFSINTGWVTRGYFQTAPMPRRASVQQQHVQVNVEVQRGAEALHEP